MAHYASNLPRQPAQTRFDDGECLIHLADDGQVGIILHDGSGRYSIIQFCPWCGAALGLEAGGHSALVPLLQVAEVAQVADREEIPRGIAPRSHKAKGSKPKGRQPMPEAKRQALSEKMRLLHAQKKRQEAELAAMRIIRDTTPYPVVPIAPGQDEDTEIRAGS